MRCQKTTETRSASSAKTHFMPGKGRHNNRCKVCDMNMPLCLCPDLPSIQLDTKLLILMHWRERKLTSNSARLAALALKNSEVLIRGEKDAPLELDEKMKNISSAVLLFPTDDAIPLTLEFAATLPRPLTLIVPDGSWRQAKKVSHREKSLARFQRVTLPVNTPPSQYRLRHHHMESSLSTFEAIARAVGVLEGRDIQEKLEELFLKMVERRLWGRGFLPASECITTIPEAAFTQQRLAGARGSLKKQKS